MKNEEVEKYEEDHDQVPYLYGEPPLHELNEPAPDYLSRSYTMEEYFGLEGSSEEKHEFFRGEVFVMQPPRLTHNLIVMNVSALLMQKLAGKGCRPHNSNQRLHIPANTLCTYPDISVVCGKVQTLNNDEWNLLNPTVIFEVLSHSTRNYDRVRKFILYQSIPTLREYVLIDSEAIATEVYQVNGNGNWGMLRCNEPDKWIYLESIRVRLSLKKIYEGTKLVT
ncbi:Uma2 family endonuclease [Hufsiella ginkgonis]|uniref:Uma2 family endonuclease n=1 Tax=Hufsiella ginkgonis TaxID=2695274 RepID=A0A7K1XYY7_9SPHI|nr:Uma2 family endonuclease [Hufsiella ginkgonis]MXV16211.1 Uma2 family endonuclease [Hufsiella ginkgonis]